MYTKRNLYLQGDKAVKEINAWAKSASRGLIKDVLNNIGPKATFIQANALYFKGTWSEPFEPTNTQTRKFFLLDGTTIQVPFLTRWKRYDYGSFDGYKVLRAPYLSTSNTSFSMYFFLPDERTGIQNLLEIFNSSTCKNSLLDLDLKKTSLEVVRIPKFKFSYGVDVTETLRSMGLEIPYKGNLLDYAAMMRLLRIFHVSRNQLFIRKHLLRLMRMGPKASTVTILGAPGCAPYSKPPPPKPKFVADHPFVFVIKEDIYGLVFFTGIMLKPEEYELSRIPSSGEKRSRVDEGTQTSGKRPSGGMFPD